MSRPRSPAVLTFPSTRKPVLVPVGARLARLQAVLVLVALGTLYFLRLPGEGGGWPPF